MLTSAAYAMVPKPFDLPKQHHSRGARAAHRSPCGALHTQALAILEYLEQLLHSTNNYLPNIMTNKRRKLKHVLFSIFKTQTLKEQKHITGTGRTDDIPTEIAL